MDGVPRFNSYRLLPDYQLVVTVGLSEKEVLAEFYYREKIYILAVSLLSFFIIGFCAMLMHMKRLEREFARLERLNLIGEMAAGIGHEVRNPLTTVRGFLQVLGSKQKYGNDIQYFNLMIEEIDRACATITEYLSLSKDRAVEKTQVNLNDALTRLLPLIKADAIIQDKDIKINIGEIPEMLLDEKQIRQLVLNIARNGLEAMSSGGCLSIRTFMDNEEVVLAIRDEGKGIEPHIIDKIGTPFFTTKDNGTGLGLAVCYSIADRHNASIKLESSQSGTTFFIRFKQQKN
jgi:signal transduction histidine kinase